MSTIRTGNVAHDSKVNAAEAARQAAVVATASRKAVLAAEATFYRAAVGSAQANSCGLVPFMSWLRENGQSLYP